MNQEPDADILDVETEEWHVPESGGNESAAAESHEHAQMDADEGVGRDSSAPASEDAWLDPAEPASAVALDRLHRRHARPRDLRRLTMLALSLALIIAVGFALYFWLRLDAAQGDGATSDSGNLTAQLARAEARLAETDEALRAAQVRVVDAETEVRALQEQLDATVAASADTDDELAEVAEQLRAVSDSLTAARNQGEALASAVLGSVDPVDACVRAAARVAQNVDQIGRGQLAKRAQEAAAACAAAQDSLAPAVNQAGDLLAD